MDIDVFPAKDLDTVFSVLRTALRHSGALHPRERLFLAAYARITGYSLSKADPIPLIAQEVHIEGAHQRKRLIQLAAVAALLNRPVTPGSARFLRELSWQLKTRDSVVGVVDAVEKGRRFRARMLAARRGMGMMIRQTYLSEGVMGVLRFLGVLRWRGYWRHMTEIGFGCVSTEIYAAQLETAA